MILVVTGGRRFGEWTPSKLNHHADLELGFIACVLRSLKDDLSLLVHGDCKSGADACALWWARNNYIPHLGFPAPWRRGDHLDRSAGPRRNGAMLEYAQRLAAMDDVPVLLVAFPGGKGTADCVKQAERLGIPVRDERGWVPGREQG